MNGTLTPVPGGWQYRNGVLWHIQVDHGWRYQSDDADYDLDADGYTIVYGHAGIAASPEEAIYEMDQLEGKRQ